MSWVPCVYHIGSIASFELEMSRTCAFCREFSPRGALQNVGNYFESGSSMFIDLQHDNDAFYFVADYHALTSVRNAAQLAQRPIPSR